MEIKTLEFKNYNHISIENIRKEYGFSNPSKLKPDEFNSFLSLLFSYNYHYPNPTKDKEKEILYLFSEKDALLNTTRDFGRQMIENLDGFNKEWLENLQSKTYKIFPLNNAELLDFVDFVLIDFLNIRDWEYGRVFIQNFSKLLIDTYKFDLYSNSIKKYLENDNDYLKKIGKKIIQDTIKLETHEALLLVFVLKENLFKSKMTIYDYSITNYIVKENMYKLCNKKEDFRKVINNCLSPKWFRNKGKGGPTL